MRVLPIILALSLPGMAVAQTPFKIFPQLSCAKFDQTCTSFTSRCGLGAPGGEVLQEYAMNSWTLGAGAVSTDFFRGIGENAFPNQNVCTVGGMFYITQDQNCIDQEAYSVVVRPLCPQPVLNPAGPDTAVTLLDAPLMTPPNGAPSPCAWGVCVAFATPVTVPCASSFFIGIRLANNQGWVANGQSQQGTWYNLAGPPATPPSDCGSAAAPAGSARDMSWEIFGGNLKRKCGTVRSWDMGVLVNCPTLNIANVLPAAGASCPTVITKSGLGGLYPSNTAGGQGIALNVRDLANPGAPILSFMSFAPSPINLTLVNILQKSIWIGPAPFIQITFGTNALDATGWGYDSAAFLGTGRLTGSAGQLWFQSILAAGGLPLPTTNAAATQLSVF